MAYSLRDFVRESNRIEGILRVPTAAELEAHDALLDRHRLNVTDIQDFVHIIAPGKRLREVPGMNVRVGQHIAPDGGPQIVTELMAILDAANVGAQTPYALHRAYETLHPFMDGNGRSGRALWLWMMGGIERAPLGFLHHWYYQSLQDGRP